MESRVLSGAVPAIITGVPGAQGVAIGTAVVVSPGADLYAVPPREVNDRRKQVRAFREALEAVRKDIQVVADNLGAELSPEDHALFDVYLSILDDSTIGAEVVGLIKGGAVGPGRPESGDDRAYPPFRAYGTQLSERTCCRC